MTEKKDDKKDESKPKKKGFWSKVLEGISQAIGEAMFGGNR